MLSDLRIIPIALFFLFLSCKDNSSIKSFQENDKISSSVNTLSEYWKYIKANTDIQEEKILKLRSLKNQHLQNVQRFKLKGKWKGRTNSKLRKKTNSAYIKKLKSVLNDENFQSFQKANTSWKKMK